jgi:hypothetical protein
MHPTQRDPSNQQDRLGRLFAAYREACPDLEGSANFVPRVWEAIERSRPASWIFPLRLWARRLVMSATLATGLLIGYLAVWQRPAVTTPTADVLEASYLDVLTAESLDEQDAEFWRLAENQR